MIMMQGRNHSIDSQHCQSACPRQPARAREQFCVMMDFRWSIAFGLLSMLTLPCVNVQAQVPQYSAPGNYAVAPNQGIPQQNVGMPTIPQANAPQEPVATDATAEASSSKGGLIDLMKRGGLLMIPIIVCSLAVICMTIERLISLRRSRIIPRAFTRRFMEMVEDGQLSYDEALEICEEFDCPTAEVFRAAIKRWGRPLVEVEQAVIDAGERASEGLRRFLRVFSTVSNVSPLFGLLGTVSGMIQAFHSMSSGSMGAEQLGAGISEALITTAAGLSVAIPAYIAYMFFSAKADVLQTDIDRLTMRVVESISAEGLENRPLKSKGKSKKAA